MLIFDKIAIGNKLLALRKLKGFTQAELAERAELADRTYADIERGQVNMRVDTLLHICAALQISPNDLLTENDRPADDRANILHQLASTPQDDKSATLKLIAKYLDCLA